MKNAEDITVQLMLPASGSRPRQRPLCLDVRDPPGEISDPLLEPRIRVNVHRVVRVGQCSACIPQKARAERHALRAVTCDARRQGRILVAQVAQCLEVRLGRLVACRPLEEDVHIAIYPVRDDRNEGAVGDVDTHGVHQPRDEQISAAWYCEEVHDGGGRLARRGEFEERRWELALAKTRYIRVDWFEMCCRVAFEQNIVNICSADMANGELLLSEYPRLDANIDNIALVIESRLGDERDEERRPRPVSSTLVIENGLERANRNDVEGGYAVANANIRHGFLF